MSVFWIRRKARKTHSCEWGCGKPIERGAIYQQAWITPSDVDFGTGRWYTLRYHSGTWLDCPVTWTASQIEAIKEEQLDPDYPLLCADPDCRHGQDVHPTGYCVLADCGCPGFIDPTLRRAN